MLLQFPVWEISIIIETVGCLRNTPWLEIPNEIDKMIKIVEGFSRDWGRLPEVLKVGYLQRTKTRSWPHGKVLAFSEETSKGINLR